MTSTWTSPFPHCKVSPPIRLSADQCTNGRNSVFSDPGYSSAANSVTSEYQENEFSYFENQISPKFDNFNNNRNMSFSYDGQQGNVGAVKTEGGFRNIPYTEINTVDNYTKMQFKSDVNRRSFVAQQNGRDNRNINNKYGLLPAVHGRRNRSTSDMDSRFQQYNSCAPKPTCTNYANPMQRDLIEIPSISVEDYIIANENVFNESGDGSMVQGEEGYLSPPHSNGQYLSARPGSRLPSTESFYDGSTSVASTSPIGGQFSSQQSPCGNLLGFNENNNSSYITSGRSQENRVFLDMNSTSTTPVAQTFSEEEEAWNYMNHPLGSSGISDAENVLDATMGRLYEYYKVPQESRVQTCQLLNDVAMSNTSLPPVCKATSNIPRAPTTPYANLQPQVEPIQASVSPTTPRTTPKQTFAPASSTVFSLNPKDDQFIYAMEAPKSLKQKEKEPTMSYINKGQFYCITLRRNKECQPDNTKVRSVVQVVFGDCKPEEEQIRHWRYWHARQHTAKQRIIDIADYKESSMVYDIEEISHNAIAFTWDPSKEAKIYISVNCLSTDFSAQKGIKGLPLLIQIDTYPNGPSTKMHRGVCQIKVFCDKGAERKIRDEERKVMRKSQKNSGNKGVMTIAANNYLTLAGTSVTKNKSTAPVVVKKIDEVFFKTVFDLTKPVYFIPDVINHAPTTHSKSQAASPLLMLNSKQLSDPLQIEQNADEPRLRRKRSFFDSDESLPIKMPKSDYPKSVLLYVRSESEEIYNGLMLRTPDLHGLKSAIEEKYSYSATSITQLLKRSKKGVVVNMDDNIIQHYCDEDTFILTVQPHTTQNGQESFSVTLTEV